MRLSLRTVVPVLAVATCGLVGLTAPLASASPAPPTKSVPAAAPAVAAAPSSKVPAPPADKAVGGYQQIVSVALTDPANSQVSGSAVCPKGTKVIGGGALVSSSSLAENVNGSVPLSDNRTWRAYVNNSSATAGTFRVYATCAAKVPSYAVVVGTAVDNLAGTQSSALVACPTGTVPLGGGGLGSSTSTVVNLNSTLPQPSGWRVDVNNASSGGDSATAVAVCGAAPKGYAQTAGASAPNAAGTQNGTTVSCTAGLTVLGGGVFSGSGSTVVSVNSSVPSGTSTWTVFENNASAGTSSFTPYVVCAKAAA